VDELTRLFLAACDGDRTVLLLAGRARQLDVRRLAMVEDLRTPETG
jgi:hypothetical protein